MKRRIVLSLLALFLFFAAGSLFAVIYMRQTNAALERLITLHQIEDLRQGLIRSIQKVQAELYAVGTPLGSHLDEMIDHVSVLENRAAACLGCHHNPEIERKLKETQTFIEKYKHALSDYVTAAANRNNIERLMLRAAGIGNTLLARTTEMSHNASQKLAVMTNESLDQARIVRSVLVLTILLTFAIAVLIAFRLTRFMTRPVSMLVEATRAIAAGNLDHSVSYQDKTEFGELADHFNLMSSALKNSHEELKRDIIQRRKAEDEIRTKNLELQQEIDQRRHAEDALRESERRFRETLENAHLIALQLDLEGTIVFANAYLAHLTNWDLRDIVGRNWFDLFVPAEQRTVMMRLHQQNAVGTIADEFVSEVKEKHGRRLLIAWTNSRMMDDGGKVIGITALGVDITQRRQIEEHIQQNEKLETVGRLAGGIAHDFNNLLQGIFGFIAMAKLNSDKYGKPYDFLTQAEESLSIATNLTNQLLTFAKGGKPVIQILAIDTVIKNAVRLGLSGSRSDHHMVFDEDLWHVEADAGQIGQVIQNIVINANDAMPEGGRIAISAENMLQSLHGEPVKQFVKIMIADTGSGIREEHLKKIFDPYFTTKKKGTGLGLATAYSIIRNHNGLIEVESTPNQGTTFYIYLPASADAEVAEQVTVQKAAGKAKGKILVMDDEDIVLGICREMLKALGHDTETAKDGDEAIAKYREAMNEGTKFDIVILDLTIRGGMGGADANRRLHEIDPSVKTIISSGYSDDATIAKYVKLGFKGYLKKPYRLADLKDMLSTHL